MKTKRLLRVIHALISFSGLVALVVMVASTGPKQQTIQPHQLNTTKIKKLFEKKMNES